MEITSVNYAPARSGWLVAALAGLGATLETARADDWRIDCRPATNIDRRNVVGQSRVTARHTGKNALAFAIGFVNMPTLRASAARVAGVNQHHRHTSPLGFVGDKRPQLKERPTMQGGPLSTMNRYPVAYPVQIFQSESASGVFRLCHQLLADTVVRVLRKAMFFTGEFFQMAFGRPRAFGLQLGPQAAVTKTYIVDVAGRVNSSIRIDGDIGNAQIHAERPFHVNRFGFFHIAGSRQEEHIVEQAQIRLTVPGRQQFPLALAADQRNMQPTVHRPDRDFRIFQAPRQDPVVIGDTSMRLESALGFGV